MQKDKFYCCLCGSRDYEIRNVCQNESELVGCYSYKCRTFHCLGCGQDYPTLESTEHRAFRERVAFLLLKNYPPERFRYYSSEELLTEFNKVFVPCGREIGYADDPDISINAYYIQQGRKKLYFGKSIELILIDKFSSSDAFNLTLPEDWSEDYREKREAELVKYAPLGSKYPYLTESEVLEKEKSSQFWFNKKHLDFFTYNVLQPDGTRMYLKESYEMYRLIYNGWINLKSYTGHALDSFMTEYDKIKQAVLKSL